MRIPPLICSFFRFFFKSLKNATPTIRVAIANRTNMIKAELRLAFSAICEPINPDPQMIATNNSDRLLNV